MNEELLIRCVKRYPELYDHHHPLYTVTGKKSETWATIARELGETAPACKARWNSMRDAYRKSVYRNVVKIRKGEKTKFYKYSHSLAFLKNFVKITKEEDKSDDEVESEDDNELRIVTPNKLQIVEESESSPTEFSDYYSDVVKEEAKESPVVDYQQGMSTIDSFLSCIGATLKSLPPYYASLAKADMFACVHKYELRAITNRTGGPGTRGPLGSNSEASDVRLDPLEPQ